MGRYIAEDNSFRLSICSILMLTFVACSTPYDGDSSLSNVPVTTPTESLRFDSVGDSPLSFLGITSFVLNDGNILLPDWQQLKLFKIDTTGELIGTIGRQGNGPGEFQDITVMSPSPFGSILIYDQMSQKMVVFDDQGHYDTEFLIPSERPPGSLIEVYEVEHMQYLMVFQSFDYIYNENVDQVSYLVTYNRDQEIVSLSKTINSRPYARSTEGGSGRIVPYAASDLLAYDHTTAAIFLYRSSGHSIAQLDASLDTTVTTTFDLEPEILTKAESDSIGIENPEYWESMQILLPEYKALADQMMVDQNQNFWLKLNHASDYEQWLAVSEQGDLLQIIQLPKNSMLTHISEDHLGVRLDDITFALYEYPESLN